MSTIALLLWPLVTLVLVLSLPFPRAAIISVLGGFLLLPPAVGINLPLLPVFNKDTIPALSLFALALLLYGSGRTFGGQPQDGGNALPGWLPRSWLAVLGLVLLFFGSLMTAFSNGDRLVYGPTVLPAMRPYDGFSLALSSLMLVLPLLLGRKFFAHPENQALLLRSLVIAGLAYSLLVLFEARMSPQLNIMIYGYFQHSWVQHIRGGGWRPVVFMEHGLQLAIFLTATTLAAFGAWRVLRNDQRRGLYLVAGTWLLGTLVLTNSFGALVIAVAFVPVVLFLGVRLQVLVAGILAGIILLYPMLRSIDVIPTRYFVSMAEAFDPQRAGSLQYRLDNEDILLEHARSKPLFGWGGWNRHRVFDESGRDISTTDGAWIIAIGKSGWVGYLAQFGLLTMPIILLALPGRRRQVSPVTAIIVLVLVASLIDLIPNGFLSPLTLLLAGALWGRVELGAPVQHAPQIGARETPRGSSVYARAHPSPDEPGLPRDVAAQTAEGGSAYTRQTVRHRRRLERLH